MKSSAIDKRIERLYYARCSGIQIPLMQITSVFSTARVAVMNDPGISDEALGDRIFEFVSLIAVAA